MTAGRRRARRDMAPASRVTAYAVLVVWSLIVLLPFYWVAITSFKLPIQVSAGPNYLPFVDFRPSVHAWAYIFAGLGKDVLRPYFNSVVVAAASTVVGVGIGSMAAYALTRLVYRPRVGSIALFLSVLVGVVYLTVAVGLPWAVAAASGAAVFALLVAALGRRFTRALGNDDILFWMISQRIMPPVVAVLPIYIMFQKVGLLDTRVALVVAYAATNLPIVVWLMRDFFASIPIELEESAQIDGASRLRILATIVLPLAQSGLAATSLLVLILSWNEYLLALFLSTANAQTMPILVAAQNATRGPQWWYMSVLIVIMIVPVIGMTVLLQRFIRRGLLVGAVKG